MSKGPVLELELDCWTPAFLGSSNFNEKKPVSNILNRFSVMNPGVVPLPSATQILMNWLLTATVCSERDGATSTRAALLQVVGSMGLRDVQ